MPVHQGETVKNAEANGSGIMAAGRKWGPGSTTRVTYRVEQGGTDLLPVTVAETGPTELPPYAVTGCTPAHSLCVERLLSALVTSRPLRQLHTGGLTGGLTGDMLRLRGQTQISVSVSMKLLKTQCLLTFNLSCMSCEIQENTNLIKI